MKKSTTFTNTNDGPIYDNQNDMAASALGLILPQRALLKPIQKQIPNVDIVFLSRRNKGVSI